MVSTCFHKAFTKEHVNPVKTNLVDFSKSSERAPPPKKQNTVLLKCWENHPNSKAKKKYESGVGIINH